MRAEITRLAIVVSAIALTEGFMPNSRSQFSARLGAPERRQALVDPNSLVQNVVDIQQTISVADATETAVGGQQYLSSLLSTMYSTGIAHGHESSWFGPPNPYLEAGKSIAPPGSSMPPLSPDLPKFVQELSSRGVHVMDGSRITAETHLPGFKAPPSALIPAGGTEPSGLAAFFAKAEWANDFSRVLDKLPGAAFAYCLVEFFFLRPNVDLYKGEIEQESATSLMAGALATFTVRFIAMGFIAILTLAIFG